VSFNKHLTLLIIGSVLIFSGCGTTLTNEENEKYAPVDKESTSQNEVSTKDDKSISGKSTSTSSTPTPKEGTTDQIPVTLVSTTDGDTIRVMYKGENEPVRYLLIDTPETNHPRLGKQPFGEEAKELNRQLVTSGNLTLEFDIGEKRDKYGRLLAYVYVDGKSVQETLISNGMARVAYIYPPNTRYLTPYEEAQQVAKSKKLGIWAVEDYATDSGFNSGSSKNTDTGSGASSNPSAPTATTKTTEWFDNCTHLRTKYPNGVAGDHPAYQAKMDRDKDNFACER